MNAPVVTIRADCNAAIGYGHVMRCLAVAAALKDSGVAVRFAMAPDSDRVPPEAAGYDVMAIATDEIITALDPQQGPLLLDSYEVGVDDLESLRAAGFRVALFDDAMRLKHYACDVVVDSAPDAPSLPYRGLPETRFCLGADYFPLRREFAAARREGPAAERAGTVVVTFGGGDPDDVTFRALGAIADIEGDFTVLAALGPAYAGRAVDGGRVRTVRNAADMAALLAQADLAICGGGGTAIELAYLGVPSVVLSLSPDQVAVARALAGAGAADYINDNIAINDAEIKMALRGLLNDRTKRQSMRDAGRSLIDGRGTARIANAIRRLSQQ